MLLWPRCVLLAGMLSIGTAAQAVHTQPRPTVPPSRVVLEPGDYVRVSVFRKPEFSGEFLIAADSSLKHPLYQDVHIGGQTVAAGLERLRTFLQRFDTSPQVSIEPLFQVTVGGEVRNPNLYKLSPEITIAQAVALAGGPTERGRLNQVRLLRQGREQMLDMSGAVTDAVELTIASGDRIIIGRKRDSAWEYLGPIANFLVLATNIIILVRQR